MQGETNQPPCNAQGAHSTSLRLRHSARSFELGAWPPAIVCCRGRELCGVVHGDDFIITVSFNATGVGRIKGERFLDGGDDQDGHVSGRCQQSVATPAVKVHEWTPQMLTKLDEDRASTFRSATMCASDMSIDRLDVQQAVKEVARFMAEPNEGAWSMLKRLVWYFVGHGRLVQVITEQRYVKAPRVGTDSDYAVCVLTHLFHDVHFFKAGSWSQGARSLRLAESEFHAGVRGRSILLGEKSMMLVSATMLGRKQTAVQQRTS